MGLDQYMFAEISKQKQLNDLEVPEELEFIKSFCMKNSYTEFFIEKDVLQIAYWRKEYDLDEFMREYWDGDNNWDEREFNCQHLYIEEYMLDEWEKQDFCTEYDKEIIKICRKILDKGLKVYYTNWW